MVKRIAVYLNEMFPVSSIMGSVLMAVAVQLIYLRLFDVRPASYFPLIVPGMVLTLISLLIRVMDEFKDYQDDLTNFPGRPLPSGRVKREDLKGLGIFCVIMVIFLSMTSMPLLIWSIITLGFTFLMLKWFFIESIMRKSLPLAFITHHPIILFNFIYLVIACTQMDQVVTFEKAYYIFPLCFIFTNWEVERKIRAPEQETSYTTYSKIMGPRPAILIAIVLQLIFNATVLVIFNALNTMWVIRALFVIVQILLMIPAIKFLVTLKVGKPLKQYAELQILTIVGFLLLAALV